MLPLHLLISPATAPKYPMSQRHQQYGFSLLELVVVMGILAIFASVSLTFVGEKDVQQRYNESLEKLTMVKRNFLSVDKYQGQMVMHGFFIDNGLINDGMTEDERIDRCVEDDLINVEDKEDEVERNKCILKTAVSTSLRTILNSRTEPVETNDTQQKANYRPFSFISDIHVEHAGDNDSEVGPQTLKGAGLYKGIRPGAFDLSQYQDANNEIRDAWGDKFKLYSEFDTSTIQVCIENKAYKYLDSPENATEKCKSDPDEFETDLGSSKSKVDINYSDLVVNVNANFTLKIDKKKLPQSGEFRFAVVSFDNSADCRGEVESCWTTQLSDPLEPTSLPTTFALNERLLTTTSDSFDNTTDLIISVPINTNGEGEGEKITELVFTDIEGNKWSLTTQPFIGSAKFEGNLTVGSHVVVLLEKESAAWKIYDSDSTPDNVNHIFEYLHIFPGQQTPNPITMSIP